MKKSLITPLGLYLLILVAWILAWILKTNVFDEFAFFISSFGGFLYWTVLKLLIWILPWLIFFWYKKLSFIEVLKTKDMNWLKWGLILGGAIAAINIVYNLISKQPVWNMELSFSLLTVAVVAPLLEEILFRGFMLNLLKEEMPFYLANIITSVCFLAMHMPGWYFMGALKTNLYNFTFISIFLLNLLFGYAYRKGNSVKASMIVHFFNNIT